MARRAFYSFHYIPDNWRAAKVRNMGVIEGNAPVSDNDWETVTKGGDEGIKRWIAGQLDGKGCTIVLIGTNTAGRKWINYEIVESWNEGKAIVGVYIHNLKDRLEAQSTKGANPFGYATVKGVSMASIVKTYDPPYTASTDVYKYISDNLSSWIEEAVGIRANH